MLFIDEIENNVRYLINEQNESNLTIATNPYIYAYLTRGFNSFQMKWFFKYKKWIKVKPLTAYHFLEYHFFNKNNDEIKL